VTVRKILKIGNSYYINIPRQFIELHGLKAGERIPVLGDQILKVVPMKER